MLALIHTTLAGGGGDTKRLLALGALIALLAAALLPFAPAAADEHLANLNKLPDDLQLVLGLEGDPDNIVQAGDEFTVTAALRFSAPRFAEPYDPYRRWVIPAASVGPSNLRLTGEPNWESSDFFKRLTIPETNLVGFQAITAPNNALIRAFDERTIVARTLAGSSPQLQIYDAWTKQPAGTVTPPPGATAGAGHGFGLGAVSLDVHQYSNSVGLWHETDSTAWMFVASPWDTVGDTEGTHSRVGRVYVYRLEWAEFASSVEATLEATLEPDLAEVRNRHEHAIQAEYGSSLMVSRDGSTLAIAATKMNIIGAVYVYTRPDGPGQNWGDIRYEDGVKVTPVIVPSLGTSDANKPFTHTSTGRTSAATDCDAYCSRVSSFLETNNGPDLAEMGIRYIDLSADGRVLAVPASEKNFSMQTPGGSFAHSGSNTYYRDNKGEVYVYVAPEGGWNAAPRADRDADGNPKTLIPARTDARSFNPETHYSPGPLRRITAPDAVLVDQLWPNAQSSYLGEGLAISPDGTTVVADGDYNAPGIQGRAHIFQQSSVEAWQALEGGYMTPTAIIENVGDIPSRGNMAFSSDHSEMAIVEAEDSRVHVFRLPANGRWASGSIDDADEIARRGGVQWILKDGHNGAQVVFGQAGSIVTSDAGCTIEVVDGISTTTCPITLANAKVVVPKGTPDGTFTISGQVTVQQEDVAASKLTLRDELEVRIGDVTEVAEARLELATDGRRTTSTADDRPFPSLIERGGKTRLRLQILDENGKPSPTGSVSNLLLTTTLGGLTSLVTSGACSGVSGGPSCTIPAAAVTGDNSDELLIELAHPGKPTGTARVWATVLGADGETLISNQVTIDLAGPPAALAIAPPAAALLGYDPTEAADLRNRAALVVSATDESGSRASVPDSRYSAKLTDPDGKTVALTGANRKAEVVWPLRQGEDDADPLALRDGNPQARVTILAAKTTPLATGEYTLELSVGAGANKLTATQTFNVAGGAAEVTLSADPSGEVEQGASIIVTARVADASGAPSPDGTPVTFSEGASGVNAVLVLLSQSRQLTVGGEASITLRAVGRGRAWVRATADEASNLEVLTVAAPPPPPLDDAIAALAVDTYSIWTDPRPTSAAELYDALEGVAQLSKWDGIEWLRYGETNGLLNSGSVDFVIRRGEVLWLDSE